MVGRRFLDAVSGRNGAKVQYRSTTDPRDAPLGFDSIRIRFCDERKGPMKRLLCATLATTFFMLSEPQDSSAQASVFLGGGMTFPVSDFNEFHKTGWQGWGGVLVAVGDAGLSVGAEGFYGSNGLETDGNKRASASRSVASVASWAVLTRRALVTTTSEPGSSRWVSA